MSKIALEPNASGTGTFSIASPNSNTSRTLTLPDVDGTVVTADASGNVGIGNASPTTALDVTGTVTATAFAGPLTGAVTGNASTATTLQTPRAVQVSGAVTGTANFDGSAAINIVTTATSDPVLTLAGDATGSATFTNLGNATLTVAVVDDSHSHSFNNLINKTGGTGDYTTTGTFTGATFNATSTTNGGFQGIDADTITAPSFTWTSDLNTGMWHPAADQIGFTTGGVNRLTLSTTALTSTLGITAPTFTGALSGNATTATALQTGRTIALSGAATGTATSFNGGSNISIPVTSLNAANLTGNVDAARITNALNATGSAPLYTCRAWVNFNGTGTVAIRASGNVSSITDNGTGDYTVNFTTAMPDANYSWTQSAGDQTNANRVGLIAGANYSATTTSLRVRANAATSYGDVSIANVAIFR